MIAPTSPLINVKIVHYTSKIQFETQITISEPTSIQTIIQTAELQHKLQTLGDFNLLTYAVGIDGIKVDFATNIFEDVTLELYRTLYQSPRAKRLQRIKETANDSN